MNAITVIKRAEKYIAMFRWSAETKDAVKAAGFRFNPDTREWWTADKTVAASFGELPQGAPPRANGHAKPAASPPVEIPAPNGLTYLPFQRDGILALAQRKHALLADQMGLGKTVQAIGLINVKPDITRVLIICPASLKLNWKNELIRWCARPMTIGIIPAVGAFECDIVIINYEQVAKHRDQIDKVAWNLLICDESHYLKSAKAQRTQAIIGKWDDDPTNRIRPIQATRKLWMTGTPILNRPKELWTTVRALDRTGLGENWHHFHTRYCDAYEDMHGWQLDGASNLEELKTYLYTSIMVRRLKADVLPDLPAKRRQVVLLPADTVATKRALQAELELADTEKKMNELRAEVERKSVNQADVEYKKAVQELETCESIAFEATATIRHQTALAKLPSAMDFLVNVLENEEKIVVFTHHRNDMIDPLCEGLAEYGVVKMDGRDNVAERQQAVHAFQTDPKVRVIIGTIAVMGTGHTLTAASYVAFVELDWVPGNMEQAEDRLHRIGQKNSILIQHLMLDGSFDGRMAATVIRKMNVIGRAVG